MDFARQPREGRVLLCHLFNSLWMGGPGGNFCDALVSFAYVISKLEGQKLRTGPLMFYSMRGGGTSI